MAKTRGASIRVVLKGDEELQKSLTYLVKNTADLRYAWREFYNPGVIEGNKKYWATEGDGKWPDLSDQYLFYKAKSGAGTRLLYGTPPRKRYPRPFPGTLMRSFTGAKPAMRADKFFPKEMWNVYSDPLANIFFTAKGKRARKPLNIRSLSFRMAFNRAARDHLAWYDQQWGGRRVA